MEYTAYPHEKEILFYDGMQADVKKVSQVEENNKVFTLIQLTKQF